MHFGIASNTGFAMAFLTIHDGVLREALLAGLASRCTAALKVAVNLRCLEGELKVSNQSSH